MLHYLHSLLKENKSSFQPDSLGENLCWTHKKMGGILNKLAKDEYNLSFDKILLP